MILILYAGIDDQSSTAAAIQQEAPWLSQFVVEIDIARDKQRQDMLKDNPYKQLHKAAKQGRILAILGGPNYKTFTTKPPLRGRNNGDVWGLSCNSPSTKLAVENENILLLRMLQLANIARFHNETTLLFLLEHPADPALHSPLEDAGECPTIWGTSTLLAFGHNHRLYGTTFSKCMMENVTCDTTKILHNIPLLRTLDNLKCNHNQQPNTKELATRWGWKLNILIAQGISAHLKHLRNYDHTKIINNLPKYNEEIPENYKPQLLRLSDALAHYNHTVTTPTLETQLSQH